MRSSGSLKRIKTNLIINSKGRSLALRPSKIYFIMKIQERPIYQLDSNQLEWVLSKMLDKKFDELIQRINMPEVIYTRDEAAGILNVRPNTVSSYINQGLLTNKGVGRKVLISSKEIDQLLNKKQVSFNQAA
jgi:RNase P/RNase MRP subunit POP5